MSQTCLRTSDVPSDEDQRPSADQPVTADQPDAAPDESGPGARVPSLGVLESRPLTDREREVAYAAILWRAMYGGC